MMFSPTRTPLKRTTMFASHPSHLQTPSRMSSLAPSRFNVVKSAIRPSTNKKRATDGNDGKESNIKVAVRIRPINNGARSFVASGNSITEVHQQQPEPTFATPRRKAASEYIYDSVYGEQSTTHEIYNEFVSNIVSSVVNDGVNGTVFSYGQTGSGKTHTMQGGDDDGDNGVIQLAANQIFDTIKQDAAAAEYKVKVSYLEIYIEDIVDLLADSNSAAPLEIRGETINNLVEREVASYEELMRVFRRGDGKKTVGSTNMNHRSSRSHSIFRVTIEKKVVETAVGNTCGDDKENSTPSNGFNASSLYLTSVLSLVDLAGSESAKLTGAQGQQLKEGGAINQSLTALGLLFVGLSQKEPINTGYRNYKLTRILKPLLQDGKVVIICCINPSLAYCKTTEYTLKFAERAKRVKTTAVRNTETVHSKATTLSLSLELEESKVENDRLKNQNVQLTKDNLQLANENDQLQKQNELLQKELEEGKKLDVRDRINTDNNESQLNDHNVQLQEKIAMLQNQVVELEESAQAKNDVAKLKDMHEAELMDQLHKLNLAFTEKCEESEKLRSQVARLESRQSLGSATLPLPVDILIDHGTVSHGASDNKVDNEYVGKRVAKYFAVNEVDILHEGTVTSADDLYHAVYDDGDVEDMNQDELLEALRLYRIRYVDIKSRVVVDRKGRMCKATVHKGRATGEGEQVQVHYDGNKESTKSWIPISLIHDVLLSNDKKPTSKRSTKTERKDQEVIDLTNEEEEEPAIPGCDLATISIRENQHVWVGKAQLEAIVLSVTESTATVKYTVSNMVGDVALSSIEPMPFDDSSRCKRKRRQTNRYLPA